MELLDVMFAEYELFHTVKVEVHKLINFVMQKNSKENYSKQCESNFEGKFKNPGFVK